MIPKINSSHGAETRNIINRVIEVLNQQGKSLQDLVAEGQLTEEQYAELLTTINSLVKRGNIDKSDLTPEFKGEIEGFKTQLVDKLNKGKVARGELDRSTDSNLWDINDFNEASRQAILENNSIDINYVLGENAVTSENIADNSVRAKKIYEQFFHGDVIRGEISVNTQEKTISFFDVVVSYGTAQRSTNDVTLSYSGTLINIFFNMNLSVFEVYPVGNLSGLTTQRSDLLLLGTIYNDYIYNAITIKHWVINGVSLTSTSANIVKNAIMTSSNVYGRSSSDMVTKFDEVNKSITIPEKSVVVVGDQTYENTSDVVIDISKDIITANYRTLLLFNTSTKEFSILPIPHMSYNFSFNTVILGSFHLRWSGDDLNLEYIQANFPYREIKRIEPTVSKPSVWNSGIGNFIGDSITEGNSTRGSYIDNVKDILGLSESRNYGIGGSALCYRDNSDNLDAGKGYDTSYPPVVSRWQDMDDNADFNFMLIGTNDYSSQVPIGTDDSQNEEEFKGALNVVLDGLADKYPGKTNVVSTLLHRISKNQDTHPLTIDMYNQAIRDIVAKHPSAILYDADKMTGMDFVKSYYTNAISDDGLHPNANGSVLLGQRIAGFINTL